MNIPFLFRRDFLQGDLTPYKLIQFSFLLSYVFHETFPFQTSRVGLKPFDFIRAKTTLVTFLYQQNIL